MKQSGDKSSHKVVAATRRIHCIHRIGRHGKLALSAADGAAFLAGFDDDIFYAETAEMFRHGHAFRLSGVILPLIFIGENVIDERKDFPDIIESQFPVGGHLRVCAEDGALCLGRPGETDDRIAVVQGRPEQAGKRDNIRSLYGMLGRCVTGEHGSFTVDGYAGAIPVDHKIGNGCGEGITLRHIADVDAAPAATESPTR